MKRTKYLESQIVFVIKQLNDDLFSVYRRTIHPFENELIMKKANL